MGSVVLSTLEDDRIILVQLNRPKANILDKEMITDLKRGIMNMVLDQTAAIVISHSGPHFSFGASVEEHTFERAKEMLETFHDLFHYLHALSIPLIAAVNGQCLGGGLELASFCHFLFAHSESQFGQPEIKLGVFPPMASLTLNIKAPTAVDAINLTGASFSADEFYRYGLITEIVANPEEAAIEYVKTHFLKKSASSLRHAVKANRWKFDYALTHLLPKLEKDYIEELMKTKDANEGIESFLEKRKPQWRHV